MKFCMCLLVRYIIFYLDIMTNRISVLVEYFNIFSLVFVILETVLEGCGI